MGRTTKQLSGGGKDKFLRALIAAQDDLAHEPADRLVARLTDAITDIRVKRDVWDDLGKTQKASKGLKGRAAKEAAKSATATAGGGVRQETPSPATAPQAAPAPTFDPFAFSALAVLTRGGRSALESKVAEIGAAEHLIALAAAQHLGIDRTLTDVAALRTAIVDATESRLKERRAAAS